MWHTANAVKTLYDFTMSEWYKKNHLEQDATDKYTIQLLTQEKLDYSAISEGISESIQYRSYNEEMKGLDQFPSHTFAFPNTSCSFSPLKRLKMLILCGGALLGDLT